VTLTLTPDQVNGLFELTGAILTARSAAALWASKGYAGITLPAVLFFTSWGGWNLFYYPHLNQMFSLVGGAALFTANVCWLSLMLYYGKMQPRDW
jgi:ABC-type transport system involved in cytochrome c biogenesis permease subunit